MAPTKRLNDSFSTNLFINLRIVPQEKLHHVTQRPVVRHSRSARRILSFAFW